MVLTTAYSSSISRVIVLFLEVSLTLSTHSARTLSLRTTIATVRLPHFMLDDKEYTNRQLKHTSLRATIRSSCTSRTGRTWRALVKSERRVMIYDFPGNEAFRAVVDTVDTSRLSGCQQHLWTNDKRPATGT